MYTNELASNAQHSTSNAQHTFKKHVEHMVPMHVKIFCLNVHYMLSTQNVSLARML